MLGGGGFTSPGVNPEPESIELELLSVLEAGYNIRIEPLPPPFNKIRIDAYASGSQGEIQFAGPPPEHHFTASHKLVWDEAASTLQVQEKLSLFGLNPEILINGTPLELPKKFVAGHNIHIVESTGVPPTVTVSAVPSGQNGEIQFNRDFFGEDRFAATNRLKWDNTNYRLEVQGGIYLNGDELKPTEPAGAVGQLQWNAGGTPPEFGASGDLFWDDGNSRLGIGTQSPTSPLTVDGGIRLSGGIWFDNPARPQIQQAFAGMNGADLLGIYSSNTANWIVNVDLVQQRLGIGTQTPQAVLDVNGAAGQGAARIFRNEWLYPSLTTDNSTLRISGSINALEIGNGYALSNGISAWLQSKNGGNADLLVLNPLGGTVTIGGSVPLLPNTVVCRVWASIPNGLTDPDLDYDNAVLAIGANPCLKFGLLTAGGAAWLQAVIYNAVNPILLNPLGGNVGVGTLSPQAALSVMGAASDAGDPADPIVAIGAPANTGRLKVGAWATWPNSIWLQGEGSSSFFRRLCLNPLGGGVSIGAQNASNSVAGLDVVVPAAGPQDVARFAGIYEPTEEPRVWFGSWSYAGIGAPWSCLTFSTSVYGGTWEERMRIDSQGRVGIGTQAPQAALDVVGQSTTTARIKGIGSNGSNLTLESDAGAYSAIALIVGSFTNVSIYQLGDNKLRLWGGSNVALGPLLSVESTYPIRYPVHLMASSVMGFPSVQWQSSDACIGMNLLNLNELVFGCDDNSNVGWMQYRTGLIPNPPFVINPAGGNVGIGMTTEPQFALDVNGIIRCNNYLTAGANSLNLQSDTVIQLIIGGASSLVHTNGQTFIYQTVSIDGDLAFEGDLRAEHFRTTDPGPGAKRFWADPADGYRVKFAQ